MPAACDQFLVLLVLTPSLVNRQAATTCASRHKQLYTAVPHVKRDMLGHSGSSTERIAGRQASSGILIYSAAQLKASHQSLDYRHSLHAGQAQEGGAGRDGQSSSSQCQQAPKECTRCRHISAGGGQSLDRRGLVCANGFPRCQPGHGACHSTSARLRRHHSM